MKTKFIFLSFLWVLISQFVHFASDASDNPILLRKLTLNGNAVSDTPIPIHKSHAVIEIKYETGGGYQFDKLEVYKGLFCETDSKVFDVPWCQGGGCVIGGNDDLDVFFPENRYTPTPLTEQKPSLSLRLSVKSPEGEIKSFCKDIRMDFQPCDQVTKVVKGRAWDDPIIIGVKDKLTGKPISGVTMQLEGKGPRPEIWEFEPGFYSYPPNIPKNKFGVHVTKEGYGTVVFGKYDNEYAPEKESDRLKQIEVELCHE